MPKTITVAKLKSLRPCRDRWPVFRETYPDRESVTWQEIVDSNGFSGLLWVASRILSEQDLRTLIAGYLEHALQILQQMYPEDSRVTACIQAIRGYSNHKLTYGQMRECCAAYNAVGRSIVRAARAADSSAAYAYDCDTRYRNAVLVATNATNAVGDAEVEWQIQHTVEFMENYDDQTAN